MSTSSQIAANQANAQQSTGPRTHFGKSQSSQNRRTFGFTGGFCVLGWENQEEYDDLHATLVTEHQPASKTEELLVENMARHYWLTQRAQLIQDLSFDNNVPRCDDDRDQKQMALLLRYQIANDRAFHKCLDQLQKLRAERRKSEIGFESQHARQSQEVRKAETHEVKICLAKAKIAHQELQTELRSAFSPFPKHATAAVSALLRDSDLPEKQAA